MSETFAVSSGADNNELCEFRDNILPVLLYLEEVCEVTVVRWLCFCCYFNELSGACHYNIFQIRTMLIHIFFGCKLVLYSITLYIHPEFICFAAPELDNETGKKLIYSKRKWIKKINVHITINTCLKLLMLLISS